ncbi:MAG: lyase family protein, partial [Solirubrobacterales bacterium]
MIERYSRPVMAEIWSDEAKLDSWLSVELAATAAWAAEGVVPEEDAAACREKAAFTVAAVHEREQVTDHDVAAFVDVVSESVGGDGGRWIHYGLTSSDVLDTALAVRLGASGEVLREVALAYLDASIERAFV